MKRNENYGNFKTAFKKATIWVMEVPGLQNI